MLIYKPNKPIVIIEAKDNKRTVSDGMQQALQYANMMNILSKGENIISKKQSKNSKECYISDDVLPADSLARKIAQTQTYQSEFEKCDASLWFINTNKSVNLYSCTRVHKESNTAMTILRW